VLRADLPLASVPAKQPIQRAGFKTHAWNPQQGTMFCWNPRASKTQVFFNDRDVKSGKVFTVLSMIRQWIQAGQ
jgi:hypothetical protein